MSASADEWSGWIPFGLTARTGQAVVEWGYMGRERYTDPFFETTVQYLLRRPYNQVFRRQTGFDHLLARAETHPGLPLHGLVFHMGRCGSTLVAQALAALPDSVVLSEPESLNTLLKWLAALPAGQEDLSASALRALLAALGQPRRAGDGRLFLKAACWNITQAERILAAFPGTPWLFLYRDPVEALVSQRRALDPSLMAGALSQAGFPFSEEDQADPLAYAARVMGGVLDAAGQAMARHPGGMLLHYRELPAALETRLASHFQLDLSPADQAAFRACASRDAKYPQQAFQDDRAAKQAAADATLHALAARWLDTPYAQLERSCVQFLGLGCMQEDASSTGCGAGLPLPAWKAKSQCPYPPPSDTKPSGPR